MIVCTPLTVSASLNCVFMYLSVFFAYVSVDICLLKPGVSEVMEV